MTKLQVQLQPLKALATYVVETSEVNMHPG